MSSGAIIAAETALVFGGVLALAIRELVRLRRGRRPKDTAESAGAPEPPERG